MSLVHKPTGIGIYTQSVAPLPPPKKAAKIAADAGVSFVALYAVQQDVSAGRPRTTVINKPDDVRRYAEAFATAGIAPWIWGYPWAGREDEFVTLMAEATSGNVVGWVLDPELGYKWRGPGTRSGQREATTNITTPSRSEDDLRALANKLQTLCCDVLENKRAVGVTSYGMVDYHKNFPWRQFAPGTPQSGLDWGSPQLYDVSPAEVDRGIGGWRALGWDHVVPSVPAFGRKSGAHLHDFLSTFVDGHEGIGGMIFWSWTSVSPDEWRVVARWADWFRRFPVVVGM